MTSTAPRASIFRRHKPSAPAATATPGRTSNPAPPVTPWSGRRQNFLWQRVRRGAAKAKVFQTRVRRLVLSCRLPTTWSGHVSCDRQPVTRSEAPSAGQPAARHKTGVVSRVPRVPRCAQALGTDRNTYQSDFTPAKTNPITPRGKRTTRQRRSPAATECAT
jgi:hypothetical protein